MMACNTPFDLLSAYVDGELAPPEELELRRHLDVCETCQRQVENERKVCKRGITAVLILFSAMVYWPAM